MESSLGKLIQFNLFNSEQIYLNNYVIFSDLLGWSIFRHNSINSILQICVYGIRQWWKRKIICFFYIILGCDMPTVSALNSVSVMALINKLFNSTYVMSCNFIYIMHYQYVLIILLNYVLVLLPNYLVF